MPYTSSAVSRVSRSKKSTTTTITTNPEANDRSTSSSIDVDDDSHISEQNQFGEDRDAFEKSSDDESQVSGIHTIIFL